MKPPIDPLFRVEVIEQTPNPQKTIYAALKQDYAETFVHDDLFEWVDGAGEYAWSGSMTEAKAGEIAIKRLLNGNRGHYGPLEHPQIVLNCGYFPHSVMQQLRTHRHLSFDVQSSRYTGQRLVAAVAALEHIEPFPMNKVFAAQKEIIEPLFYLRPVGAYHDRSGKHYDYTELRRNQHVGRCLSALNQYADDIAYGMSEEHARGMIPFDVRQHWVMSMNLRSLMAILLIRGKADAQLEIQQLCHLILPHFEAWAPDIYQWFMENLWQKGRLSP
ncbi:MAG: FAD-dependent thymidylate synthase [Stenomitos frigidus ULC029]